MAKNKPRRIVYFDCLKILAIFMVVVLHVSGDGTLLHAAHSSPEHFGWWGAAFWDNISLPAVALFVMVSGALFISKPELETKTIWTKYIFRLAIIYFAWVLIYSLYSSVMNNSVDLKSIIVNAMMGGHGVLWFLPMLMLVYACLPLMRKIASDKKLLEYALIIFAVILFYNTIATIIQNTQWRPDELGGLLRQPGLVSIAKSNVLYIGYALLGYYLYKYDLYLKLRRNLYIFAVAAVVFVVVLSGVMTQINGGYTYLYAGQSFATAVEAAALFLLFKNSKKITYLKNPKTLKVISYLGTCTLGIYLIHEMVLVEVLNNSLASFRFGRWSWVIIPLLSVIIAVISLLVTVVLRRVPGAKKIVE